ncbi:hypothetical protein ACK1KB_10045 [Chryseobacterium sp. TY3]
MVKINNINLKTSKARVAKFELYSRDVRLIKSENGINHIEVAPPAKGTKNLIVVTNTIEGSLIIIIY